MAPTNTYGFSSKEFIPSVGLYYYLYRFYDSGLQRWVNRDPVDVRGGINLYAFVKNSPISARDSFGLSCENPCEQAKQQGLDKGNPGGTVCCEGLKYACVWNASGDPPPVSDKGKKIAAQCLLAHEISHTRDPGAICPPGPGCGGGVTMAEGAHGSSKASECAAFKAEEKCYESADCGGDPQCVKDVLAMQKNAQLGISVECGNK